MSEVTIRLAREDELGVVGELTINAYHADGFETSGEYALKLADARPRWLEAELLVAVDDTDTVLGTVTVAPPGSPWAQVSASDELEFRMLAVSPAARGRGVGEALTRRVIERAEELGLRAVTLSSSQSMVVAHRLYERLGFPPHAGGGLEPGARRRPDHLPAGSVAVVRRPRVRSGRFRVVGRERRPRNKETAGWGD